MLAIRCPGLPASRARAPNFHFDTVAGRYVVLSFLGSAGRAESAAVVNHVSNDLRSRFDDDKIAFFGVTIDAEDEAKGRVAEMVPGIRYFFDFDTSVSALYGAADSENAGQDGVAYRCFTLVLDPFMRVMANIPISDPDKHNAALGARSSARCPRSTSTPARRSMRQF